MGRLQQLVAVLVLAILHVQQARGCNAREVTDMLQRSFRESGGSGCLDLGFKCDFDRQCCKGLECRLSASNSGVESTCQPWVYANQEGMENIPVLASAEPWTDDEQWIVGSPELSSSEIRDVDEQDVNDKGFWEGVGEGAHTGTIDEIEELHERKKLKLLRENEALEKLFTEKDRKELEQLRALKEDAEMDELRKLKELRLKRKLELIKELRELRGLKAEEGLDWLYEKTNKTETVENEVIENNSTQKTTAEKENTDDGEQTPMDIQKAPIADDTSGMQPEEKIESDVTKNKEKTHGVHQKRKRHRKHKKTSNHTIEELQSPQNQTTETEIEQ